MRIKKELKEMFDKCKTYGDIFKTVGDAKKAGFDEESINAAATYRKNTFAKETKTNYKHLAKKELNMNPSTKYMTINVQTTNLTSNKIVYTGEAFII